MHVVSFTTTTKPGRAASLVFGLDAEPDTELRVAKIEHDGVLDYFSKAAGSVWRHDGQVRVANSFPVFMVGAGSMLSKPVTDVELLDLLDELETSGASV